MAYQGLHSQQSRRWFLKTSIYLIGKVMYEYGWGAIPCDVGWSEYCQERCYSHYLTHHLSLKMLLWKDWKYHLLLLVAILSSPGEKGPDQLPCGAVWVVSEWLEGLVIYIFDSLFALGTMMHSMSMMHSMVSACCSSSSRDMVGDAGLNCYSYCRVNATWNYTVIG